MMISNNNNSTIILNNNNKCNEHTTEDIVLICIQCDNTPICMKCILSKGIHNKHDISEIMSETVDPILKELQTITIPTLNESLKQKKSKLLESDNQLIQLEVKHNEHTNQIKSTFQRLHNNITSIERDLIKQLDTTLDENKEINSIQHSSFDNNNKLIDSLNTIYIKNNNNKNNNNNNNQHNNIEILKHNHQCKKILSDSNNNSLSSSIHFKQSQLNVNNIDEINDSIKSLFTINTIHTDEIKQQIPQPLQIPIPGAQPIPPNSKEVTWLEMSFQLCREGITYKEGRKLFATDSLSKLSKTTFPSTANHLMLLDGFNESLESIPKSIRHLYLFDIKLQLLPGTIPNHIQRLYFCDGFNQTITKDIIPSSVTFVYLGDIVKPLDDPIPNTVRHIYKSPLFKHTITSDKPQYKWDGNEIYKYV